MIFGNYFSLLMSVLVLPLAGWVWTTNVKVAELQNDLGDAEHSDIRKKNYKGQQCKADNRNGKRHRVHEGVSGQDRINGDEETTMKAALLMFSLMSAGDNNLKRDL